jgi:tetratricopeptide (TPR) repeat protein
MSRRSKGKATAAKPPNAPVSPAGELPGVKGSCSLESKSGPVGLNNRWTVLGVCFFLAAITWGVFGQTLHYGFVNYDDNLYVYENTKVAGGLALNGVVAMFTHVECNFYHPLTMISLMLNYQLHGLQPGGYHLVNVLLHTLSVVLLFLILRRITGFIWRCAFVAAVFAIHPLRVESVAWVAERKDVLSGFFFMLTLWAYARYADKQSKVEGREPKAQADPALAPQPPTLDYCLTLLFFALGLMSKSSLVTLPFVLLLLDYWPLDRFGGRTVAGGKSAGWRGDFLVLARLVVEKVPLFALSAAAAVMTVIAEGEAIAPTKALPLVDRIGNPIMSYVTYLRQMVYPAGLTHLYPISPEDLSVWKIVLALVLLVGVSAAALAGWRKRPYLLVGWSWYLGMLVPMIGIMRVGSFVHADRYTYLPQIGLYLLLTWAAVDLCAGWRHRRLVLAGLSTAILVALTFCARTQVSYWRNNESLWTRALACTSDNFIAQNNLGNVLLLKGQVDEAMVHYQMALRIRPDEAEAHYNFGLALFQKGQVDEAIAQYQKALQIRPDDAKAHNNLGNALLKKGGVDEAMVHYQKALQFKPDYAEACYNLGNTLLQKGRVDEAITQYQKALQIRPDDAKAHNNLGNALLKKGGVDEAITEYQKALQLAPDNAEIHNHLGGALLQKGSIDEAISHFQKALQFKPDYAEAHNNLGNALFQKGNVAEAITHFQKVLQIKPESAEAQNNLAWLLATAPQASLRNGPQAVELTQKANQLAGGKNPIILRTLAAACAETGRFPEAVETAQRALQLAEAQSNSALADDIRSQLTLYQAGTPFHSR